MSGWLVVMHTCFTTFSVVIVTLPFVRPFVKNRLVKNGIDRTIETPAIARMQCIVHTHTTSATLT